MLGKSWRYYHIKMADYDLLGNIAIIKSEGKKREEKLEQAKKLLENPGIKTVFEKASDVSGRLRTIKVRHIAGEKNKISCYKENGCIFNFNVETCYFSPRLSNERKENSNLVKMKDRVLVMFAGIGPYPIVIYKYSRPKEIVAIELGKECCKYFKENLRLNEIPEGKIKIIQGDVKNKITEKLGKFDVVIMARPNLRPSFLKQGLIASKKGTLLIYHGFCHVNDKKKMIDELINEAKTFKRKIKLIKSIEIGNIAPYKYRFRLEFKVLN